MAKFRKKPVVVDAWEFDGGLDSSKTLPAEIKDVSTGIRLTQDGKLRIPTLEGTMESTVINKDNYIRLKINVKEQEEQRRIREINERLEKLH